MMVSWTVEEHELSEGFSCVVYDEHGQMIADHLSREQAHKIAAAPDLYETAEEVARGLRAFADKLRKYNYPAGAGGHDLLADKLEAALAKARGEPA